jgi:hypothetical protein
MPILFNQSVPDVRCDLPYRAELYSAESGKTPAVDFLWANLTSDSQGVVDPPSGLTAHLHDLAQLRIRQFRAEKYDHFSCPRPMPV